mmetsp:Transcript_33044/g.98313  ORF Transcript_33044/g.98313 Transcript_33044/m.98313 type:complete len:116 (-) Transcript_33044:234-581(-)
MQISSVDAEKLSPIRSECTKFVSYFYKKEAYGGLSMFARYSMVYLEFSSSFDQSAFPSALRTIKDYYARNILGSCDVLARDARRQSHQSKEYKTLGLFPANEQNTSEPHWAGWRP